MRRTPSVWALLLAAALAGPATAQDFLGSYDLDGTRSDGASVSLELQVTHTASGRQRTVRKAHVNGSEETWFSGSGRQAGNRLVVLYQVDYSTGLAGAVGGSTAGSNRFLGVYRRSSDGLSLSETVYNLTRNGPEAGWTRLRTRGIPNREHAVRRAALARPQTLADAVMEWRTDVADYYEPGDEDYYRDDSAAAETAFTTALWDPVAVPTGFQAFQALASHLLDPREVVEPGRIVLLFDVYARVTTTIYEIEGETYVYDGSWEDLSFSAPPAPAGPGVNMTCAPGSGIDTPAALASVRAMRGELADFIMTFRTDIADYYDPGDQAYYDADARSAEEFFRAAIPREVPVPNGYTAYKAIRLDAPDPGDVILGTVTVLLDCDGKRITIVYDHEGEVYDEDDI